MSWPSSHVRPSTGPSSEAPTRWSVREIGRRTGVVGIFPDDASVLRLVSMLAIEANDEWLVGRAYISQKSMAPLFVPRSETTITTNTIKEEVGELIAA